MLIQTTLVVAWLLRNALKTSAFFFYQISNINGACTFVKDYLYIFYVHIKLIYFNLKKKRKENSNFS